MAENSKIELGRMELRGPRTEHLETRGLFAISQTAFFVVSPHKLAVHLPPEVGSEGDRKQLELAGWEIDIIAEYVEAETGKAPMRAIVDRSSRLPWLRPKPPNTAFWSPSSIGFRVMSRSYQG
jgi:hypothetical protein